MPWPSIKNAVDASYFFISFSRATGIARSFRLIVQLHRLNPHWEMDKTFSPSYSPSEITYVEAEAVGFSRFRFRFHRKRTASTASSFRFHIPGCNLNLLNNVTKTARFC